MSRLFFISALLVGSACRRGAPPEAAGLDAAHSGLAISADARSELSDAEVAEVVRRAADNFRRVHFDTDSSSLSGDSRAALDENATIFLRHPELQVSVEGHADERGTTDYNLALGHRRAVSVQRYLGAHGVGADRIRASTMGEERPLVEGSGVAAWAANRRAEFRVTWGGDGVVGTSD